MPIHSIRADLSNLPFSVDFIVNTANPKPKVGNGLDKALRERAGEGILEERKRIGDIAPGDIAVTDAYDLKAEKVIHAVSVAWTDGLHDELLFVRKCYQKALACAVDYMEKNCLNSVSIAMPLIGTGIYQIPIEYVLPIALFECSQCVLRYNVDVYLVAFDESSTQAMRKVLPTKDYLTPEYSYSLKRREYVRDQEYEAPEQTHKIIVHSDSYRHRMQPKSFVDLLMDHMNKKKMDAPHIYNGICLTRQSFSDIYSGKKTPKKETIILIAIRLGLSLSELEELLEKAGHSLSEDKEEDRLTKKFFLSPSRDIIEYGDLREKHGFAVK